MKPDPSLLDPLLDAFVGACIEQFGRERVEGIILHGSAAKGGFIPGYSDLDLQVFLTPRCFDGSGALPDAAVFAMQERVGPLPWQESGFRYPQAYFIDPTRLPEWWAGPAPGSYRLLHGRVPPAAEPTPEKLRASGEHWLTVGLPRAITADLEGFVDADDTSLPRRLRLLGTRVTPTIFALLAADAADPLAVWAQPKDAALGALREQFPDEEGPHMAAQFFEDVRALYGGEFDIERGRAAFRRGIAFLRWAQQRAESIPNVVGG